MEREKHLLAVGLALALGAACLGAGLGMDKGSGNVQTCSVNHISSVLGCIWITHLGQLFQYPFSDFSF